MVTIRRQTLQEPPGGDLFIIADIGIFADVCKNSNVDGYDSSGKNANVGRNQKRKRLRIYMTRFATSRPLH